MGWMRAMFLGDLGNWMDTSDNAHKINQLRLHATSKSRLDRSQNERLRQLERETDELKMCLSAMAHLLVSKDVLSKTDLAGVIVPIEEEGKGPGD